MVGWSSPSILLLTSKDSPLPTGRVTTDEASWIASLKSVGFTVSSVLFGVVANRFGRKWPLFFLSIPTIVRQNQEDVAITWLRISGL